MTTHSLRRTRGPVLVLCRVDVCVPSTNWCRVAGIFGRRTSVPCAGRKEGPQGRDGAVKPLALRRRPTITKPLHLVLGTGGGHTYTEAEQVGW